MPPMRMLFSVVGLLVVALVVMFLAKSQLKAVAPGLAPAAPGAPVPTVQEQSRQLQQQVTQGVARALEQGAARASAAQP